MKTPLQMVALLCAAAVAGGSEYLCSYSPTMMYCNGVATRQPPAGYWPSVVNLDLSGTDISELHTNSFSGFPALRTLYLRDTPLEELDLEALAGPRTLATLYLEDSRFRSVVAAPPSVYLSGLQMVFLNNNSIAALDPNAFASADSLEYLFLNRNPITVADGRPVLNHESLRYLHMQYGSTLGNLGPASFEGLPNIHEMVLLFAGITSIDGAFTTNLVLQNLALNGNPITEVNAGTFAPTDQLRGLHLAGTALERLDVDAVRDAVPTGGSIDITNTPLACACAYQELDEWARAKGVTIYATCSAGGACRFARPQP